MQDSSRGARCTTWLRLPAACTVPAAAEGFSGLLRYEIATSAPHVR